MGAGKKVWGYYKTGDVWLPVQVNVDGKLIIVETVGNLGDIDDVDLTGIADGDTLIWDDATSKWIPGPGAAFECADLAACALDALGDVYVPDPDNLDVIIWNEVAGKWVVEPMALLANLVAARTNLGELVDVYAPDPGDQYFLYWDDTSGKWTCRILLDEDIPAGIARDAEVADAVADEATARDVAIAAVELDDLADVNVPTPADGDILTWDADTSKWIPVDTGSRIYTLAANTCIWRAWANRVSSTARTATVSSIAGDVITLTANEAYRFGDWGASPEYMNAANVYIKIRNATRGDAAWVKASTAANKLTVTAAADIAAWSLNDIISTDSGDPGSVSNFVELDISPLLPAGATAVFLSAQVNDNGVISSGDGVRFSKAGLPGTWNAIACQVSGLAIYGLQVCQLQANRHLVVRDLASGVNTLQHAAFVTMYIK